MYVLIPVSFSADNPHARIDGNLQISQIRPKAEADWSHVFFDYGSTPVLSIFPFRYDNLEEIEVVTRGITHTHHYQA